MEITEIASEDLEPILALVKKVATSAILPSLGEQGREYFISKVLPDTSKVLDTSIWCNPGRELHYAPVYRRTSSG